jgi:hypothetical protein
MKVVVLNRLVLIVAFILFFSGKSMAQYTFQKGLIVNAKGDTLHGYMEEQDWELNPSKIFFKDKLENPAREWTPGQILYFELEDGLDLFKSAVVSISQDKADLDNGYKSRDLKINATIDTVFLRVLEKGNCVNLYSYIDKIKTRYYIESLNDKTPKELIYRLNSVIDPTTGEERYIFIESFKNQLTSAAMRCNLLTDGIKSDIANVKYGQGIIKIVTLINGHTEKEVVRKKRIPHKWQSRNYIGTGVAATTTNVDGDFSNVSYSPYFQFGIDGARNQNSSQFHLVGEFLLNGSTNDISNGWPQTLSVVTPSATLLAKYFVNPNSSARVFLGFGLRVNLSISGNGSSLWESLPMRAGLVIKNKVEFSMTIAPISGLAFLNDNAYFINSRHLGVSYIFPLKSK